MREAAEPDADRHFNGFNTRLIVEYLDRHQPPGTLEAVLRRAGERRPVEVLTDDSSWSSYDQIRRLLEAAAEEVGLETLRLIAPGAGIMEGDAAESAAALQDLGSPDVLLDEAAASGTSMGASVIYRGSGGRVGPGEYLLENAFVDGFVPFRAWCAYMSGLYAIVPVLFGLPVGEVEEEVCACDGAPACQFRLRWQTVGNPEDSVDAMRARMTMLQGRLDSIESTVADLVSNDDVEATLVRLAATAARTLRAPAHVLVLEDATLAAPVLVEGLATEELVEAVRRASLDDLGDADPADADAADAGRHADLLVVPVRSGRRTYGRLAVLEQGRRFRPHERAALVSYARLAAAALDSVASVVEARRQARTASALLQLSTALNQVMSSDEVAAVLARAVPDVIDCDRSVVILVDLATGRARIAASHGYPADVARRLLGTEVPLTGSVASGGHFDVLHIETLDDDDPAVDLMRVSGSVAAAVVPIVADGAVAGYVTASVTEGPQRLASTPDLEERMRGIAAQGSAAIRNGLLVDAIRHQALHDALTGLPNRTLILDRLGQLLKRRHRASRPVAVLFIDLDGFKDVNDTLGHEAGDRLLGAVADRLAGAVREGDTVGRLGGDEFVVIVGGDDDDGPSPEAVAERVIELLAEPFVLDDGRSLTVTASIGIAGGWVDDPSELLRDADVALYEAKAGGKCRAVRYRPTMGRIATERLALEVDLQAAVAEHQFFLLYQPIIDLATDQPCGVEALLRWQHPRRGVVPPVEFVPLLEETRMIVPVGAWVLQEACAQAKAWEAGGHRLTMSVNVSPRQLEGSGLVDQVRAALDGARLAADALVIEITEGAVMRDPVVAAERLHRLRAMGVRVAIDDFGTGYSSLAAVRDFPVDILKIDRSFVAALEQSPRSRALVRLFVQLGRDLALETVAEGVEEVDQLTELRGERCDHAQGYYFSRPVAAEEITRMLAVGPLTG